MRRLPEFSNVRSGDVEEYAGQLGHDDVVYRRMRWGFNTLSKGGEAEFSAEFRLTSQEFLRVGGRQEAKPVESGARHVGCGGAGSRVDGPAPCIRMLLAPYTGVTR